MKSPREKATIEERGRLINCDAAPRRGVDMTRDGRFFAYISVNRQYHCLGIFETVAEARAARTAAEDEFWFGIVPEDAEAEAADTAETEAETEAEAVG